jgi:hypothetical protein
MTDLAIELIEKENNKHYFKKEQSYNGVEITLIKLLMDKKYEQVWKTFNFDLLESILNDKNKNLNDYDYRFNHRVYRIATLTLLNMVCYFLIF